MTVTGHVSHLQVVRFVLLTDAFLLGLHFHQSQEMNIKYAREFCLREEKHPQVLS